MENEEVEYLNERKEQVQVIVEEFWNVVANQFQTEDLSEDDLMDIFAALGICAGAGMNEAFIANPTLPYQLFGILSDFSHQTIYSARYGLNLDELEEARQKRH